MMFLYPLVYQCDALIPQVREVEQRRECGIIARYYSTCQFNLLNYLS